MCGLSQAHFFATYVQATEKGSETALSLAGAVVCQHWGTFCPISYNMGLGDVNIEDNQRLEKKMGACTEALKY